MTPWKQAAERCNGEVVWVNLKEMSQNPVDALTKIEESLKTGVTLLACSAVQFQTGFQMPLESIGKLCKIYNTNFFVDGIQACGITSIDVQKMNIDFLVAVLTSGDGRRRLWICVHRRKTLQIHVPTNSWLAEP